jgi:hypothetical protein
MELGQLSGMTQLHVSVYSVDSVSLQYLDHAQALVILSLFALRSHRTHCVMAYMRDGAHARRVPLQGPCLMTRRARLVNLL